MADGPLRPRVVAPSGPIGDTGTRRARIQQSLWRLALHGVEPELDADVWRKDGYLAGPDTTRVRALVRALTADSLVVWGARGGYGSMRLLPGLDHMLTRGEHDHIFLGFSDLTALFPSLVSKGVRCVHGPVLSQVGDLHERGVTGLAGLLGTLAGEPPRQLSFSTGDEVPTRSVRGPLWGGNLTLCAALTGTPYAPSYDGAILFLEETGESAYRIDRMITQLDLSGVLSGVQAVLIGDLGLRGSERSGLLERLDLIRNRWGIPVICGLPVGHGRRNACLEVGVDVTLSFRRGTARRRSRVSMAWD